MRAASSTRLRIWAVTIIAATALPLAAPAQILRVGREFQVNAVTFFAERDASVAADGAGNFVVAWDSTYEDVSADVFTYVYARRFSSAAAPLGSQLEVTVNSSDYQAHPSVAAASAGPFVVAWERVLSGFSTHGALARRFSSAGAALANAFLVNAFTSVDSRYPAVTAETNGDFVVVWNSDDGSASGVFARRFSSAGTALANEFQVNIVTVNGQRGQSVAADADGDFVVAWQSLQDGSLYGVFARRFSSDGTSVGSELQINTYTPGSQFHPSVAADADGDFVVAWESANQDGSSYGVFARRFSSAGAALTSEFQVNSFTGNTQSDPSVAADVIGDFVVAWSSSFQDGSSAGVFARRFSSAGVAMASELQVNFYTADGQYNPSVTTYAGGRFVVVWQSYGQDGAQSGIFAQRFVVSNGLDFDGDGLAGPLTDGLLLLRYLFGFRGATLIAGAVAGDCARCDASSIEAHLSGLTTPLPLAEEIRLGSEFQVNTYTANSQTVPAVATSADGGFVVAWGSFYQDGDLSGIFARRFSTAGVGLASEFQVNSFTISFQSSPSIAVAANGDFVVAWSSFYQDASSEGVFARRFSSAGAPLASEFQVNTYTSFSQTAPSVAAGANGGFIVAWQSTDGSYSGIFARRFTNAGASLASEFQVNIYTTKSQSYPSVAVSSSGDFVVAWGSDTQDGAGFGVFARRFSGAGAPVASEFQVNTYTTSGQERPSVAVDAGGDFVVTWQSFGQDGSSHGVFARRFSSAGGFLAVEFQVNTYTTNYQRAPSVAADADGDFVVAWRSGIGQDGSLSGVFARRFSSAGARLASEFQVNTYSTNDQSDPSVAVDAHGRFVIAWQSNLQDDPGYGVFAQRFLATRITMDIDGNGVAEPLTDGLLVLRYVFGFRGATLVTGAVGAGCSRCDAAALETYLAGLGA